MIETISTIWWTIAGVLLIGAGLHPIYDRWDNKRRFERYV